MARFVRLFALFVCLLAGCAGGVEVAPDDGPPLEEDEGRLVTDTAVTNVDVDAEALTTVRVRAGVLTVWLDPRVHFVAGSGWVLRGRTSRRLREVVTFVHEDGFADARVVGPTSFEISLRSAHELSSMLAGLPLFVRFVTASGVPNEHQARLVIAPRLVKAYGSASIRFDGTLTPIAERRGHAFYRARVHTAQTPKRVSIALDDDTLPATRLSPRRFSFDVSFDDLLELEDAAVAVTVQLPSGVANAGARVELVVSSLGLTTKSAALHWPRAECSPAIAACVAALGEAIDLGSCGTYQQVHPCLVQRG